MKTRFIFCSLILLFALRVFSQNGLEIIYSDTQYGIKQFNSVKILNDNDKKIFVQFNVGHLLDGGDYKKLDKSTNLLNPVITGY